MTFEEMRTFLNQILIERPQAKMMNAILTCYQEVKQHEKMIIELQEKVNEIAKNWNEEIEGIEDAETVNADISEDVIEEDDLPEATGAAD